MLKVAIVLLLLATLVSLFSGLFFLVKDQGHGSRVVNSLTVRVVLAAVEAPGDQHQGRRGE
ncbi:twin transmembrane helix small protein, partial [Pseudomonas aeruginosa]